MFVSIQNTAINGINNPFIYEVAETLLKASSPYIKLINNQGERLDINIKYHHNRAEISVYGDEDYNTINNFYYDGLHDLVGNVAQNLMGIDRKFQSWLEILSHALFELLSPESDDEDVTPVAFSLVPVIGDDDIPW